MRDVERILASRWSLVHRLDAVRRGCGDKQVPLRRMCAMRQPAPTPPLGDALSPSDAEWDALADRAGAAPFLRPGWIRAWWEAFGAGTLDLCTVRRDGRLAGVLPLARRRGELHSPTNFHTPEFGLLAEDDVAARELAERALGGSERRIALGLLDAQGPSLATCRAAALDARRRITTRVLQRSPYVRVVGDWPAYERGLGRRWRGDLRRCRRRLGELGAVTLTAEADTGPLEDVFRVELASWKRESGTAIAARADTLAFYRAVASWVAARGALRLHRLRLDGRTIAALYCVQERGVVYAMKGGYDAAYRRFSPGRLVLHGLVEHAFQTGLTSVELLGSADRYKLRWGGDVRTRVALEAFDRSPSGTLLWAASAHGRPVARAVTVRARRS